MDNQDRSDPNRSDLGREALPESEEAVEEGGDTVERLERHSGPVRDAAGTSSDAGRQS